MRPWVVAVFVATLVQATRFAVLVSGEREQWIASVPDDAFYYLGLGRGLITTGRWTLDAGVSTSSGFHWLQGYLSALCWASFHRLGVDAPVLAMMSASLVFTVIALATVSRDLQRVERASALAGPVLVFCTPAALVCSTSGMEWSLALVAIAVTARLASHDGPGKLGCAAAVGCFSVLARFDAVLWVTTFSIAGTLALGRAGLRARFALVAGALAGAALVALHTHWITGSWAQDSALAKLHWSALHGFDAGRALSTLSQAVPLRHESVALGVALYAGLALSGFALGLLAQGPERARLWGASAVLVTAPLVYAKNADGLQLWYTFAVIVPCATVLGRLSALLSERAPAVARAGLLATVGLLAVDAAAAQRGPWENQITMLRAAETLRDERWSGRVGAWNAGILAYYRGRDVVNLDGLANHDALIASTRDGLLSYLRAVGVRYVVDFSVMLEHPAFRARGGYDSPETDAALRELARAPPGHPQWLDSPLTYYMVLPPPPEAAVR